MTLSYSTVSSNQGGGIFIRSSGSVVLDNSTVSGNSGIGAKSEGQLTLTNSTVSDNDVGISAPAQFINTIIAGNRRDCNGGVTSLGYNLDSDGTCGLKELTDLPNTNVLLGPLRDNGGATLTHALLPGSPAINGGDNSAAPPADQRGIARPQCLVSDIGAYELEPSGDY